MEIDKRNGNVCYNDKEHVYWDENGKYISVTTLIGRYEIPFDKDFWSAYKALERIMEPDQFKGEKERLKKIKKIDINYFADMYQVSVDEFNGAQQDLLDEWQQKNIVSCERGTKIHADLENLYTDTRTTYDLSKYNLGGKFEYNPQNTELTLDKGVYPEFLIYRKSADGIFKLAGQIDLLIKDGNDIIIVDYKTNAEIKDKSAFLTGTKKFQMMKYPLGNLMDCNKMHYTLQLSTYAWMVEKLNPNFNIKKLLLIHYDHKGNVTNYELPYLKNEVIRMCDDYKKQIILENRKNARKPIIF